MIGDPFIWHKPNPFLLNPLISRAPKNISKLCPIHPKHEIIYVLGSYVQA